MLRKYKGCAVARLINDDAVCISPDNNKHSIILFLGHSSRLDVKRLCFRANTRIKISTSFRKGAICSLLNDCINYYYI
jgi:hypothetical protein